jgi:hypothetical protein
VHGKLMSLQILPQTKCRCTQHARVPKIMLTIMVVSRHGQLADRCVRWIESLLTSSDLASGTSGRNLCMNRVALLY